MASRIYKIVTPKGEFLVDANTPAAVKNWAADREFKVSVASGREIAEIMKNGGEVHTVVHAQDDAVNTAIKVPASQTLTPAREEKQVEHAAAAPAAPL